MNEITIKRHSFDLAKNRLKEFSEKTAAELEIDKVQTDAGFLGLFDHKVTGYELNRRLETIQDHFIAINTTNNAVIKEFREIYNALDVLDKEYISSIVANVKAIEKTSNDVRVQQGTLKQHNEKLAKQQSKLDAHQAEIEETMVNISKIVTALNLFKEKLEAYKHLTDIDKIWNDCKTIQNEIRVMSDSITMFSKKATEDIATANDKSKALSEQVNRDILTLRNEAKSFKEFFSVLSEKIDCTADVLNNQILIIQEISSFVEHLKNITHIGNIDSMWNDINEANESLNAIENSLYDIDTDILKLQKHLDEINSFVKILNGYTHLQDIDNIWDNLEYVTANIKKITEDIQTHQNELDTFSATNNEFHASIDTLFKKFVDVEEYAVNSRNLITELETFRAQVSALNHLMQVDEIWKQAEDHQVRICRAEQEGKSHTDKLNELVQSGDIMRENIDLNAHEINSLKEYQNKLSSISHLDDIDSIWKDVEEHTSLLIENEKREKELAVTLQETNSTIESLTKKIKYAYWIAGGATGLAIIELLVLLL